MTLHEPHVAPLSLLEPSDPACGTDAALPLPSPGRSRLWTEVALILCVIALALLGALVIGVEMSRLSASPGICLAPR